MVSKKSLSERYRLIQVSSPPDVADWWDSLPDGEKSGIVTKILREHIEKQEKATRKAKP